MSTSHLGFCLTNSDTLTQFGFVTATWVPAGAGGTLTCVFESDPECIEPGVTTPREFSVILDLVRAPCGKRFRFDVDGKGSQYDESPLIIVYGLGGGTELLMHGPGGSLTCEPVATLVTETGSNPIELPTGCGGDGLPSFSIYVLSVDSGNYTPGHTLTIVVTAL